MEHFEKKLRKWDEFRARRDEVIDKYIKAKKKQWISEKLLKMYAMSCGVKGVFKMLKDVGTFKAKMK